MLARTLDRLQEAPLARAPATTHRASGAGTPTDQAFVKLLHAFRGGLANGDEVAERLLLLHGADLSAVARRIVARELICFEWRGELWLPWVQFDRADMSLHPAVAQVAAELARVFDAWDLCCWLAAPNSSLDDRTPLEMLESDPHAVVQAARVDRFVAGG